MALLKLHHLLEFLLRNHHSVYLLRLVRAHITSSTIAEHHALLRLVILSVWVVVFVHAHHALVEIRLAFDHAPDRGCLASLPLG